MNIQNLPSIITHQSFHAQSRDWIKDYYLWLPIACVSWWLAWKFQDKFISDWDGYDYTGYTVEGKPSALGLGRSLFLGYNYLIWRLASAWLNWPPERAYLLLRFGVIAQAGLVITGIYALAKQLTANRLASFFSCLLVAASPYFIIYSGRAMSEIPGLAMLTWSLWLMLKSLRLNKLLVFFLAVFLIGLSANVREFAIFYFPIIPLAARFYGLKWRYVILALALATLAALAGMIFWILRDGDLYLHAVSNWYHLSSEERKMHPVTYKNFGYLIRFSFICSPALTVLSPLALVWLSSIRRFRLLLTFGLMGLLANLVLLANHDLPVNPRYLMTGLTGLSLICGWCLAAMFRLNAKRAILILSSLILMTKAAYNVEAKNLYSAEWNARRAIDYVEKIDNLPWNTGFIIGYRTPLIHFYSRIGVKPYWKTISPGANWPDQKLELAIDDFFAAGRLVYVDFDPELWQSGERESREAAGLQLIKHRYELQHLRDQFYRVVRKKP